MPTYQYVCTACGLPHEAVQSFTDSALTECPACGGALRKVYSAVGVVFKGSGFYKNDSRSGKNGDDAKSDSGVKAEGGKAEGGKAEGGKAEGGKAEGGKADGGKADGGAKADSGSSGGGGKGAAPKRPATPAASNGSSSGGGQGASSPSSKPVASKSA